MTKQDFQQQQKAAMKTRYSQLRAEKMRRPEALIVMSSEFGMASTTISDIMNKSNYYNRQSKSN